MKFISKTAEQAVIAEELARLHGAAVTLLDFERQTTAPAPEITTSPAITDTPAATEAPAITEAPMPTVESPPDEATALTTPTDTADQVQAVTQCLLPDDKVYIRQQLEPIPKPHHMTVYREYCAVWHRAAAAEPNEIRRENVARRAANIWLREHAAGYLLAVLQQQDEFLEVAA